MTDSYVSALSTVLREGLVRTLEVSVASFAIAVLGGLILGTLRMLKIKVLDALIVAYVELVRGIPLLVFLFFTFFGLPQLGVHFESVPSAIIAFGLWGTANGTEIVRGAIASISRGQTEAAAALGLSRTTIMLRILLPQAIRRMIPPYMSLFTAITESSSLAALIGVHELLEISRNNIDRDTALWLPLLTTVLAIYFLINYPISVASQRLERRLA